MNKFKRMKKILKQCIYQLDESSSLFVVNPDKDFTRKRKHLFGNTLIRQLYLLLYRQEIKLNLMLFILYSICLMAEQESLSYIMDTVF